MVCLAAVVSLARMDYFLGRSLDRFLERDGAEGFDHRNRYFCGEFSRRGIDLVKRLP